MWPAPPAAAQVVERPTLVQTIATSAFSPPSPDPAGIVYMAASDRFLISDSEVDEMTLYQGANLFTATRSGSGLGTGTTLSTPSRPRISKEPSGLGFNPNDGTLFVSDDDADRISVVQPGTDAVHGTSDDIVTRISTFAFGSADPEGVEYDPATGHLFVCDGSGLEVYRIDPVNAAFGDGNDVVTSFDVARYNARDCEGIGLDTQRSTLLTVDPSRRKIYELSKSGELVRTLDLRTIPTTNTIFASVTMAPTSDPGDSPSAMNYWVVDRHVDNGADPNENDGLLYELSVASAQPPPDAPPSITLTDPEESATVSGTTVVRASAFDDVGVDRVTVSVDGTAIGTDASGSDGWSVSWNTTSVADGAHTITATAVDGRGQTSIDSNDVIVDNTPPSVSVSSPAAGSTVSGTISVVASASDNGSVASVQVAVDGAVIGTDADGADGWSVPWDTTSVPSGNHSITAIAADRAGNRTTSEPVQVTVDKPPVLLLSIPVRSGIDDADETQDGTVRRTNGDVELGSEQLGVPTTAGLRFTGIAVPNGATIVSAHVQFQADERGKTATNLVVGAQRSDNAPALGTAAFDLSSRPRTTASVAWTPPQWLVVGAVGAGQQTPDISAVLQEVVDRPGWSAGNALMVIITGSGRRTAESFEGGAPPVLHVQYAGS